MAVASSVCAARSYRGVSGEPLSRCESVRDSRQARHHSAKRHPARKTTTSSVGCASMRWSSFDVGLGKIPMFSMVVCKACRVRSHWLPCLVRHDPPTAALSWFELAFAAWHHFGFWLGLRSQLRAMFTSCTIISIDTCVADLWERNLSPHCIDQASNTLPSPDRACARGETGL